MIRLGNNEVLKTLMKILTIVDTDANTNADANDKGSTIALRERCSGELKNAATSKIRAVTHNQTLDKVHFFNHGSFVQSIVSLKSSLTTNSYLL